MSIRVNLILVDDYIKIALYIDKIYSNLIYLKIVVIDTSILILILIL